MNVSTASLPASVVGQGPCVLFIHGSAVDHTTWSIQRATLSQRLRLILYDRRGTASSFTAAEAKPLQVEDHARDAADVLEAHAIDGRAVVCGSSFGAVVALSLAQRSPELVRGLVLLEPPISADDGRALISPGFLEEFDAESVREGGPAAATLFLRSVLGEEAFHHVPRLFRDRSAARWKAIRQDCVSLLAHRVEYDKLRELGVPTLLMGGALSAATYGPTLDRLATVLPHARREELSGAGHMLYAEAHRRFNDWLYRFAVSPDELVRGAA